MNSIIRSFFLFGVSCYASTALAAPVFNIVRLGLADPEHSRNDGYEYSTAIQMNETGQVRGYSSRYNGGSTDLGQMRLAIQWHNNHRHRSDRLGAYPQRWLQIQR